MTERWVVDMLANIADDALAALTFAGGRFVLRVPSLSRSLRHEFEFLPLIELRRRRIRESPPTLF